MSFPRGGAHSPLPRFARVEPAQLGGPGGFRWNILESAICFRSVIAYGDFGLKIESRSLFLYAAVPLFFILPNPLLERKIGAVTRGTD